MDADGSGTLDFQEFVCMVLHSKEFKLQLTDGDKVAIQAAYDRMVAAEEARALLAKSPQDRSKALTERPPKERIAVIAAMAMEDAA